MRRVVPLVRPTIPFRIQQHTLSIPYLLQIPQAPRTKAAMCVKISVGLQWLTSNQIECSPHVYGSFSCLPFSPQIPQAPRTEAALCTNISVVLQCLTSRPIECSHHIHEDILTFTSLCCRSPRAPAPRPPCATTSAWGCSTWRPGSAASAACPCTA